MSLRDQLQAALGTAYNLDRELTGGGMSRVFLATETALGRRVVVKVLHPELAAEVTQERFAREIMMVAKLQQANIVPLITTGHTGEVPFYTMPFVEGHSLRQRISEERQFSVPEVIGVLRDVARALAYAHEAGVVHRDIKPENILLSGGAAVVTDFGIAKAISASRTQPGAATITQAGSGIGTPAYMAPEQAAGDPTVDHRADIYAFGCLAYELLSGKPPFDEPSIHELIAAHMTKTPVELKTRRVDTPSGLGQLVMHCLAKQPSQRPQSARELLDSLDALITPVRASAAGNQLREPKSMMKLAIGMVGVVAAIVVLMKFGDAGGRTPATEPTLAVIPFVNVGGDSAQDYLADGVSDELATALGKVSGLHLSARSAAYRFRGQRGVDVREIGKALTVRYVVQGTLRRVGDQLRVSAQLTDAESGRELWSDNFDRTAKDVFRTQDDITAAIARALAPRSSAPAATAAAGGSAGTSDLEAYDLYMRGEFELRRRAIPLAIDLFQKAIARDGQFARAYAGLSQSLALSPYFTTSAQDAVFDRATSAAKTALARDSSIAEAWVSLGLVHMHVWQWDEARRYFARALAADSTDVQTHFQAGRFHLYAGDRDAALAEWAKAKKLDPFSALAASWTAYVWSTSGRTSEAVPEIARAVQYDSTAPVIRQNAIRVYVAAADRAKALAEANRLPDLAPWNGTRAWSYAKLGIADSTRAFIKRMEARPSTIWMRNTALAYAYLGLGDTANALAALERATEGREMWVNWYPVQDPLFDSLRSSKRWSELLKRVGLEKIPGAIR